jgi:phage tail-like protein
MTEGKPISRYEEFLPALLQGDPVVGLFLQAFEAVLSGSPATPSVAFKPRLLRSTDPLANLSGLEAVIRNMHLYLTPCDPQRQDDDQEQWQDTPAEFLPWLAGWVALSLRDDWPELTKRIFIRQMVPLYKLRGTKPGLEKILTLYLESLKFTKSKVTVYDQFRTKPNYFQVELTLPYPDPDLYWQQARIAKGIIDQEKPAHTYYALRILTSSMRITGQMYPFSFDGVAQPSGAPSAARTTQVKLFWIKVTRIINRVKSRGEVVPKEVELEDPVQLVVGLNARSSSPLLTQLRPQQFKKNASVQVEVQSEFLSEAEGWRMTLKGEGTSAAVTLKSLQQDSLYLSLNNLNRYSVTVQVQMDGKPGVTELKLQPGLQIYKVDSNTRKPDLNSGNTLIGTQAVTPPATPSQPGT